MKKKIIVEEVPFKEVFHNRKTYNIFKKGDFFTKCIFDCIEKEPKPIVLIFSSFKTLMKIYNKEFKEYRGIVLTTNELEIMAEGDNYGKLLKILKIDIRDYEVSSETKDENINLNFLTIEDPNLFDKVCVKEGIYNPSTISATYLSKL